MNNDEVRIKVDGPVVLNSTKAESDRIESVRITVNDQKFTFSIKLLYPKKVTLEEITANSNSTQATNTTIPAFAFNPSFSP